ncbi:MAG: SDR family oxidoreductase [Cyclobacteriaceae bacterium]|jgi:NAD(P)-dependent dehydrogenase (short-subunit alcohol dehydrogenase family)|nr:SDR family oxidoreductase [Flammeovirgaceae bacterium]MCZ8021349.1 SDR family oxidoreductase [Cytophagales bacterium]MCZ8327929.1 SDR family oxidoreductase [Cyclobacteriaceae bacterium]
MTKLSNKTAVITGGNSGIGLATAQVFLQEGARVLITGRDEKSLQTAQQQLGNHVIALKSDITKASDLQQLFDTAQQKLGKIDILFANAGVALFAPFEQTTEEIFDANLDINIKGSFFTVQKLLPLLHENSSIIFNTSVVGVKGFPGTSAYSASKAALRSLVRTLAAELVERKIRVNAVSPGPIETPIYGRLGLPEEVVKQMGAGMQAVNPMKRFGAAHEVAKTVLFFASSDSSYITGAELAVDGGLTNL